MNPDTTPTLIRKAQDGDRSAFDQLAERHRSRVEAFIHSRLGAALRKKVEPDDILQETFLRAFRSLTRFEGRDDDSFFGWLCGIVVNAIYEVAKREKRDVIVPLADEPPSGEISASHAARRNERFDRLEESLNALSPDHRQVILLARVERLPMRTVAQKMNRSTKAATQLLWRALQKLKATFGSTDSFHLPPRSLTGEGDHNGETRADG